VRPGRAIEIANMLINSVNAISRYEVFFFFVILPASIKDYYIKNRQYSITINYIILKFSNISTILLFVKIMKILPVTAPAKGILICYLLHICKMEPPTGVEQRPGACGFWGAYGVGISAGMFISIISKTTPLAV
jgi:hypothetical protein